MSPPLTCTAVEADVFSLLPRHIVAPHRLQGLHHVADRQVAGDNVAQQDENYRYPGHLARSVLASWDLNTPAPHTSLVIANTAVTGNISLQND